MKCSNKTIKDLAQMICGAHGTTDKYEWPNFIYRTSSDLTDFFIYNCEFSYSFDNKSTRELWVREVLTEINSIESSDPLLPSDKLIRVIKELLNSVFEKKPNEHLEAVNDVNKILNYDGLGIEFKQEKYQFFQKNNNYLSEKDNDNNSQDKFVQQFPLGLPFGKTKPHLSIYSEKGDQKIKFEKINNMAILRKNIYPNFTFQQLEKVFEVNEATNEAMKKSLIEMNQTEKEKDFFIQYAKNFAMAKSNIPVLIPQAWIQWHSQPKKDLRTQSSKHSDDLYRVDFVAFWNNKRYAILIDDISHYARKKKDFWLADEENYSKRLKEDRKLIKEGWEVFRISNWEIRNQELIPEILNDLKDFMGFE